MQPITPRQRLLAALNCRPLDHLPATTHHLMDYFLDRYTGGMTAQEFFRSFDLDAILWMDPKSPDPTSGQYFDPHGRIASGEWRVEVEDIAHPDYATRRYTIITPKGKLSTVLHTNQYTTWVSEHLIKKASQIDLLGEYLPTLHCDVAQVNQAAAEFGEAGIVRGAIPGEQIYGQPGCWQDAACLVGTQPLILATYDDPHWVHTLLEILQARKKTYIQSLQGARYDLIELGGGAASTTVISPRLFGEFVAPYDSELIALAHAADQKIVYHTCGGMMPILEDIAAMQPDAMETFTPPAMGGDTDLAEARRRIGDQVCMIGGFDQAHHLLGCTPAETRAAVRHCFHAAGEHGSYIISPSDHFFDADLELIKTYADEAKACRYD